MEKKRSVGFGFRGWMLIIYQVLAFIAFMVFTNYPLNILADMYGGAQTLSMIYTGGMLFGIVIQIILSRYVGKIKSVKGFSVGLGVVAMVLALGIMLIPPTSQILWLVCYALECIIAIIYATFTIGVLIGQWFPRRKGVVMGLATFAFPIGNALVGIAFAPAVFAGATPNVFGAFLPFFIVCVIGLIIGAIFVKDYPEQCGAYRDNDKNFSPEAAKAMMEAEIKAKANSVWTAGRTLSSRDFWFITIPMGILLLGAVGLMTQTKAILANFSEAQFGMIMLAIAVFACLGSWLLGVIDDKYGTKTAIFVSVAFMVVGGILGVIPNNITLLLAVLCVAIFMGASSNFTVSAAAQYWRREDFPSVFAVVNPIANGLQAIGPVVIAIVVASSGPQVAFIIVGVLGVLGLIVISLFNAKHLKSIDDKHRKAAGLVLDDALAGRM